MTAKVLIVDDSPQNIKLLQAKLKNEYYDVIYAMSGSEALKLAKEAQPDIILLDVMMPKMDGYETCRRLKSDYMTTFIPIVMVTALDSTPDNKINGLKAGADDFLTKPINDIALFARIRSLTRLKMTIDELRLRGKLNADIDFFEDEVMYYANQISDAQILVFDEDEVRAKQVYNTLRDYFKEVVMSHNPNQVLEISANGSYDLIVIDIQLTGIDGLRICSQFRNRIETRYTPMIALLDEDDINLLIKALEIGVNDYVVVPIDNNELIARVNVQIKRKRYQDALKINLDNNVVMAVTDALTGCYNRRYFDKYFQKIVKKSIDKNKDLSLMLIDIDYFKSVNDEFGHTAGDDLLKQLQRRIADNIRVIDLLVRFGGEEFAIILPGTNSKDAFKVAERIRFKIEEKPFFISNHGNINKTVSIGISGIKHDIKENVKEFIDRVDKLLYQAKREGRNRVVVEESPDEGFRTTESVAY